MKLYESKRESFMAEQFFVAKLEEWNEKYPKCKFEMTKDGVFYIDERGNTVNIYDRSYIILDWENKFGGMMEEEYFLKHYEEF
jgi:hypothetical protein